MAASSRLISGVTGSQAHFWGNVYVTLQSSHVRGSHLGSPRGTLMFTSDASHQEKRESSASVNPYRQ